MSTPTTESQTPADASPRPLAVPARRRPQQARIATHFATAPPPRPELGHPMLAANATLAAASIAHAVQSDVPWWMYAAGGALGATVASCATMARLPDSAADGLFAGAVGASAGGWLAWTAATTPWAPAQLFTLGAGAMVLGPAYGLLRWRRTSRAQKELARRQKARTEAKATSWSRILHGAGAKDITIAEEHKFDGGFRLDLLLAGNRSPDFTGLAGMLPTIERVAAHRTGLPIRPGSIQLLRGELAHQATLVVPTRDVIGETIELPEAEGPASIHEPFSVGRYVGEGEVNVHWRRIHGIVVGMNDSGKTEYLHTHIARMTRCPDNVIWLVAGNKAVPLMAPWLLPFLRGEAENPVFDWIASGIDEAMKVLLDAYQAVDVRQGMYRAGAAEFVPTADQPQITVMIEESPDLLNSMKKFEAHDGERYTFSELCVKLLRTGRSEGVAVLLLSQRGTSTMIGPDGGDLKSQIAYRSGLRIKGNFVDTNAVFTGDTTGVNLTSLPNGAMYVELSQDDRPCLAKGYYTTAEHKRRLAVQHAPYCGTIDEETAEPLRFYADRWTRASARDLLDQISGAKARAGAAARGASGAARPEGGGTVTSSPWDDDDLNFRPSARWDEMIAEEEEGQRIEREAQQEPGAFADPDDPKWSLDANRPAAPDPDTLNAMFNAPSIADDDRNITGGQQEAPSPAARELLAAVLGSDLLYGDDAIPTDDVLAVAVAELAYPNTTEGARRVAAALREVGITGRRTTVSGRRTMVYDGAALREVAQRWGTAGGS